MPVYNAEPGGCVWMRTLTVSNGYEATMPMMPPTVPPSKCCAGFGAARVAGTDFVWRVICGCGKAVDNLGVVGYATFVEVVVNARPAAVVAATAAAARRIARVRLV